MKRFILLERGMAPDGLLHDVSFITTALASVTVDFAMFTIVDLTR